jgi:hypothetical protein
MDNDNNDEHPRVADHLLSERRPSMLAEGALTDEQEIEAFCEAQRLSRERAKTAMLHQVMEDALHAFVTTAFEAGFNAGMESVLEGDFDDCLDIAYKTVRKRAALAPLRLMR